MIGSCDKGNWSVTGWGEFGFFLDLYPRGYSVIGFMGIFLILSYEGNVTASKMLRPPSVCANFISARGLGEMDLW